jgi:hypothetical protein
MWQPCDMPGRVLWYVGLVSEASGWLARMARSQDQTEKRKNYQGQRVTFHCHHSSWAHGLMGTHISCWDFDGVSAAAFE